MQNTTLKSPLNKKKNKKNTKYDIIIMQACTLYCIQVYVKRVDQTLGRHFKLYFGVETPLTLF